MKVSRLIAVLEFGAAGADMMVVQSVRVDSSSGLNMVKGSCGIRSSQKRA